MADATSLTPPSPGLSANLFPNKCLTLQSKRTRKCKNNSLSRSIRTSIICQQNAIADNSLRCPLHHFSSHIPKSVASISAKRLLNRVHLPKVRSEVGCIHLMLHPVCLSRQYVKASFIWSISSAGMKLRMFLVYTEPSTMRIGEARIGQLANVFSFRVADTTFPGKNVFFCHEEMLFKTLLMAKNRDKYP